MTRMLKKLNVKLIHLTQKGGGISDFFVDVKVDVYREISLVGKQLKSFFLKGCVIREVTYIIT